MPTSSFVPINNNNTSSSSSEDDQTHHHDRQEKLNFITACLQGNFHECKQILRNQQHQSSSSSLLVNTRGAEGWFPLALCAYYNYPNIVSLLIQNGADVEQTLEEKVQNFDNNINNADESDDPKLNDSSSTNATRSDHHHRHSYLTQSTSPLHIAAAKNHVEVCRILIQEGKANVECERSGTGGDHATALIQAIRFSANDVARFLIFEASANLNHRFLVFLLHDDENNNTNNTNNSSTTTNKNTFTPSPNNRSRSRNSSSPLNLSEILRREQKVMHTSYPLILATELMNVDAVNMMITISQIEEAEKQEEENRRKKSRPNSKKSSSSSLSSSKKRLAVNAQRTCDGNSALHVAVDLLVLQFSQHRDNNNNNDNIVKHTDAHHNQQKLKTLTTIIKLLIEAGANTALQNFDGQTPRGLIALMQDANQKAELLNYMKNIRLGKELFEGDSSSDENSSSDVNDDDSVMSVRSVSSLNEDEKEASLKRHPDRYEDEYDDDDDDEREEMNHHKSNNNNYVSDNAKVHELSKSLQNLRSEVKRLSNEREKELFGMVTASLQLQQQQNENVNNLLSLHHHQQRSQTQSSTIGISVATETPSNMMNNNNNQGPNSDYKTPIHHLSSFRHSPVKSRAEELMAAESMIIKPAPSSSSNVAPAANSSSSLLLPHHPSCSNIDDDDHDDHQDHVESPSPEPHPSSAVNKKNINDHNNNNNNANDNQKIQEQISKLMQEISFQSEARRSLESEINSLKFETRSLHQKNEDQQRQIASLSVSPVPRSSNGNNNNNFVDNPSSAFQSQHNLFASAASSPPRTSRGGGNQNQNIIIDHSLMNDDNNDDEYNETTDSNSNDDEQNDNDDDDEVLTMIDDREPSPGIATRRHPHLHHHHLVNNRSNNENNRSSAVASPIIVRRSYHSHERNQLEILTKTLQKQQEETTKMIAQSVERQTQILATLMWLVPLTAVCVGAAVVLSKKK